MAQLFFQLRLLKLGSLRPSSAEPKCTSCPNVGQLQCNHWTGGGRENVQSFLLPKLQIEACFHTDQTSGLPGFNKSVPGLILRGWPMCLPHSTIDFTPLQCVYPTLQYVFTPLYYWLQLMAAWLTISPCPAKILHLPRMSPGLGM